MTPVAPDQLVRPLLLERRTKLQAATRSVRDRNLQDLLAQVDAALARMEAGTYGKCETCHDAIEADRLQVDPLIQFCLDHLNEKERAAHERDMDLAKQIQSKLLPPRSLTTGVWETHYSYQAAGPVGGDYCELVPSQDGGSLFFALGDVAGKGVAASLLMTHLSAIFRSLLSLRLHLPELMSRANRLFCEGTPASHYATMICGRATTSEVEVCNAGHCPPLLVKQDGVQRLDCAGLPLGMFCTMDYHPARVSIGVGDRLILYSDGVTEALDDEGVEFGEKRLIECICRTNQGSATELAEAIVASVNDHRGSRMPTDDLTVLVMQHC